MVISKSVAARLNRKGAVRITGMRHSKELEQKKLGAGKQHENQTWGCA